MSPRVGIQEKSSSIQYMLCPCCGASVIRAASICACGARFVGEPLDETPIKVQRLGPSMISLGLLALVVLVSLVMTKWLAFGAVLVIWSAWRAMRRAKQDPEWYGGYKTAVATLSITILASAGLAAYGIAHIPQAFENYKLRQVATTQASMYRVASLLEEYKLKVGSYPSNIQDFKKVIAESLPSDYWDQSIRYERRTGQVADRSGFEINTFELRSPGPDGVIGNDDDIVMRDGIVQASTEVKNQAVTQPLR